MTWTGKEKSERSNARGFFKRNRPAVTNTWFKKSKRRFCSWKAPGFQNQHQLNYILVTCHQEVFVAYCEWFGWES